MTTIQVLQLLQILEAMAPVMIKVVKGIKDLAGEEVAIEDMTIAELLALKEQLLKLHPDTWPELVFKCKLR